MTFVFIVFFINRYTQDYPYATFIYLGENAAGNTDVDAILVMDGISDAWVSPAPNIICMTILKMYF